MEAVQTAHASLSAVALGKRCTDSKLIGNVSRHTLPSTASFADVSAILQAAKASAGSLVQRSFLATLGNALVFSTSFVADDPDKATAAPPASSAPPTAAQGKRKRELCEDQEDGVSKARKRLAVASAPASKKELDVAQRVVEQMLRLRGPSGEVLVQSYALLTKKLKPTDATASVVIAIRLSSGIPVPVGMLKRCMGACWQDGLVSSESSVNGVCDRDLPLTDEGAASMAMGNLPMLIVTSVPKPPAGASDA
jgi:hypothetical protein